MPPPFFICIALATEDVEPACVPIAIGGEGAMVMFMLYRQ